MYYVIMDLEWNNSYDKKLKRFFNEIIEIGAVLVDADLEVADTFSVLVRSQLGAKISGKIKELTHISNEDMYGGKSFSIAVSDLTKWLGDRDCVFMSWGDGDLRVMLNNLRYFNGVSDIPFMHRYADLQKYCQSRMDLQGTQQIGLSAAATLLGIDVSEYSTHRALEDSLLAWRCLKRTYDEALLQPFVRECDAAFFSKMQFKSKNITNLQDRRIDKKKMVCVCDKCGAKMARQTEWRSVNQAFRAVFYCHACDSYVLFSIKFRQLFDKLDIRTRKKEMTREEYKRMRKEEQRRAAAQLRRAEQQKQNRQNQEQKP